MWAKIHLDLIVGHRERLKMSQVMEVLKRESSQTLKNEREDQIENNKFQEGSPVNSMSSWQKFHSAAAKVKAGGESSKAESCNLSFSPFHKELC